MPRISNPYLPHHHRNNKVAWRGWRRARKAVKAARALNAHQPTSRRGEIGGGVGVSKSGDVSKCSVALILYVAGA